MMRNSVGEMAAQVPLCTLAVATLCIGLQIFVFLFDTKILGYVLIPSRVIYLGEYYRMVTGALLHNGLMHIVFNMMSFLSIGSGMEMASGTLSLLFTVLWSIILGGVIHCGAEWVMTVWVTQEMKYVDQPSVGFSGVIFTLALMESYRSTQPTRSVFGMIQVRTRMYPWVLLVLLSVFMPNISFVGHLSGILVGVLHVYGLTKPLMPSSAFYIEMERYWWIQSTIAQRHNFVLCPQPMLPTTVDEVQQQATSASTDPWHRFCGPPLAAIGSARRRFGSLFGAVAHRFGRHSSGGTGAGSSSPDVGAGEANARQSAEARGRLLPWGA